MEGSNCLGKISYLSTALKFSSQYRSCDRYHPSPICTVVACLCAQDRTDILHIFWATWCKALLTVCRVRQDLVLYPDSQMYYSNRLLLQFPSMLDNLLIMEYLLLISLYRQVNHRGSKLIDNDGYRVTQDTLLEDSSALGQHGSWFDDVNRKFTLGAVFCRFQNSCLCCASNATSISKVPQGPFFLTLFWRRFGKGSTQLDVRIESVSTRKAVS